MQQYFIDKNPNSAFAVIDDKDTINHMFKVMRLSEGDSVILTFPDGIKRHAVLEDKEAHIFKLKETLDENVEMPVKIAIAAAFPKGDKLVFIAQKCTELGACSIYGFPGDRSVVKWDNKKIARLQDKLEKIIQGAAEQSRRNIIPDVKLFNDKKAFYEYLPDFDKIVIAYEESAKNGENRLLPATLKNMRPGEKLLFIFGPEGGFSESEIARCKEFGAICAGLGPRIMRAETAPLYALSAASYALEF